MLTKFRARLSVEVEAFRWTIDQAPDWWKDLPDVMIQVSTTTAVLPSGSARPGDYIVRDHTGNISMVKRERFEAEYIPADEPVFEVLGRDQLAQGSVVDWIRRARVAQVPEEKIRRAMQRYQEIVDWQSENPDRVKVPD